jgi:phage gp16-like protein
MIAKPYSASSRIHSLAAMIPLDDGEYRDMLYDLYGKRSSKQLTKLQQNELCDLLQKRANAKNGRKWSEPKRRNPMMATPKQLRALEAMWAGVSRAETAEARERALQKFCKRIAGIDHPKWLKKTDIRKMFRALEEMGAATPEQYNIANGG